MPDQKEILVSVIIPTYNGEKTIRRAIESVITQRTEWTYEILICDDCSKDKTVQIAKEYGCKIYRNSFHTGGPNIGRNVGITRAKGKYVCFLDQDDEWLPYKIAVQLVEMNKGADFVSSQSIVRMED